MQALDNLLLSNDLLSCKNNKSANLRLAEKNKSNKWLSEQLDKDPAIISKWVTNTTQPNIEMFIQIAKVLEVSVNDLLKTE